MKLTSTKDKVTIELTKNQADILYKIIGFDNSIGCIVSASNTSISKEKVIEFCARLHEKMALERMS